MSRPSRPAIGRRLALVLCAVLSLAVVPLVGSAQAADDVVWAPGEGENCNGVRDNKASRNTIKRIAAGTLERGSQVTFSLSYPVTPLEAGDAFVITDCFIREDTGAEIEKGEFTFVPNNQDFSFTYTFQVPDDVPTGTLLCNYAKTTSSPSKSPASNRKASVCFVAAGSLDIEKRDAAAPNDPLAGAAFTVECSPTAPLPAVEISGLTPAPVVGNDASGTTGASGTISITGPEGTPCTVTETAAPTGYSLPSPAVTNVVIPRSDAAAVPVVIYNTGTVGGGTPAPTLTKTADPVTGSQVEAGDSITYTITAGNTGDADATGDLVDVLPSGVSAPTSITAPGSYDAATHTLTWSPMTVGPAGSTQVQYTVTVTDSASGDLVNDAGWSGLDASTTHSVASGSSRTAPELAKTADPATGSTVERGELVTYSIVVGNGGTTPLSGDLVDVLPAGVTLAAPAPTPAGSTYDATTRTLTWEDVSVAAGGPDETFTYVVRVDADAAAGDLVNRAQWRGLTRTTTHTVPPPVEPAPERGLDVDKEVTGSDPVVQPGDTLTYRLVVTATGDVAEEDVVVSDYVPGSDPARPGSGATTYVAGSAGCDAGPCVASYDAASGLVTWEVGDLDAGASRTVEFSVVIDQPAAGATVDDVLNAGRADSAASERVSNEVRTPVTEVLGVPPATPPAGTPPVVAPPAAVPPRPTPPRASAPTAQTPRVLPFTGASSLPVLALGFSSTLIGALLVGSARARRAED